MIRSRSSREIIIRRTMIKISREIIIRNQWNNSKMHVTLFCIVSSHNLTLFCIVMPTVTLLVRPSGKDYRFLYWYALRVKTTASFIGTIMYLSWFDLIYLIWFYLIWSDPVIQWYHNLKSLGEVDDTQIPRYPDVPDISTKHHICEIESRQNLTQKKDGESTYQRFLPICP